MSTPTVKDSAPKTSGQNSKHQKEEQDVLDWNFNYYESIIPGFMTEKLPRNEKAEEMEDEIRRKRENSKRGPELKEENKDRVRKKLFSGSSQPEVLLIDILGESEEEREEVGAKEGEGEKKKKCGEKKEKDEVGGRDELSLGGRQVRLSLVTVSGLMRLAQLEFIDQNRSGLTGDQEDEKSAIMQVV